jgi:hypothetical protein
MNLSNPVVDLDHKSVTHGGRTFIMRPLAEDTFTIMEGGIPVGRAVYTFGAANAVVESNTVTEDFLCQVSEAWFAALDSAE